MCVALGNLPCDGHVWEARAAAAARPRANPQFMFPRPFQEGLVTADFLQHHDQELKHNDGKVAADTPENKSRDSGGVENRSKIETTHIAQQHCCFSMKVVRFKFAHDLSLRGFKKNTLTAQ